ncbi:MAG: DUF3572 domain-containing protein [Hyphomicrobiaceae bacterium]
MSLQPDGARDAAETIALRALAFLAGDGERLGRFLSLTGIGPDELRTQAREPHLLAGVLDHLMQDETLLLVFAADAGVRPEAIAAAHFALAGPPAERSI